VENYLGREVLEIEREVVRVRGGMEMRRRSEDWEEGWLSGMKEIRDLYMLVELLEQRSILWRIISHITNF
jgi:hypothetical protein